MSQKKSWRENERGPKRNKITQNVQAMVFYHFPTGFCIIEETEKQKGNAKKGKLKEGHNEIEVK